MKVVFGRDTLTAFGRRNSHDASYSLKRGALRIRDGQHTVMRCGVRRTMKMDDDRSRPLYGRRDYAFSGPRDAQRRVLTTVSGDKLTFASPPVSPRYTGPLQEVLFAVDPTHYRCPHPPRRLPIVCAYANAVRLANIRESPSGAVSLAVAGHADRGVPARTRPV